HAALLVLSFFLSPLSPLPPLFPYTTLFRSVYGAEAHHDLFGLFAREHTGDLVVLGELDPHLGEVTAFEELVGSHGGLGGWQTRALLIHPRDWDVPSGALDGLHVHEAMIARLEKLGLRGSSTPVPDTPDSDTRGPSL